jgi:hypothetical protein
MFVPAAALAVDEGQRRQLESLLRTGATPQKIVRRCQVILLAHQGVANHARGTFHSVEELERAIYAWLASWNDKPKAFAWKATADVILDKIRRCKELAGTAH